MSDGRRPASSPYPTLVRFAEFVRAVQASLGARASHAKACDKNLSVTARVDNLSANDGLVDLHLPELIPWQGQNIL